MDPLDVVPDYVIVEVEGQSTIDKRGYTGHATTRASEDRRGIADDENEMAETRVMKRAVARASGVGLLAWEEMTGRVAAE